MPIRRRLTNPPLDEDGFEPRNPYWFCEECGHKTPIEPEQRDMVRAVFFGRKGGPKARKCPKCKSEGFTPVGV